ncbi:uncharacterized protein LOC141698451 isoform X2 [Apium graveolens]|uniref:uncharacterized protein LOC141698451 isoform X2 n=1 Tax=Apium graveolens TaxID=4045 RepID=UPI003D798A82
MKPSKTVGSHGSAPSGSRLKKQMQLTSSSCNGTKAQYFDFRLKNCPRADEMLMMDTPEINSEFIDGAAGTEEPPLTYAKLLAADSQLILDQLGTAKVSEPNIRTYWKSELTEVRTYIRT